MQAAEYIYSSTTYLLDITHLSIIILACVITPCTQRTLTSICNRRFKNFKSRKYVLNIVL